MQSHGIFLRAIAAAMVLMLSTGCAARPPALAAPPSSAAACRKAHEYLHATLWVQTAAEYGVAATIIYRYAHQALDEALVDAMRSAALEQSAGYSGLPPAVILDIDETVIDNSSYQARQILDGAGYDSRRWSAWSARAQAPAVPGALEFVRYAAGRGIEVFYISGRTGEEEEPTRRNLQALGFPLKQEPDTVLLRDERPEWGSDKSARRAHVARSYRILLLLGDDLGDFLPAGRLAPAERARLAADHAPRWGRDWFLLPNPQYGSWERALYGYQTDLTDEQILEAKRKALRPF